MQQLGQSRVLITGGAGFLGSHLCRRYIDAGWEVLCVDNFHTGRKGNFILRLHELDCAYLKYAGSRFCDIGFFGRFRPENIFGLGVKRKARTDTEHGELKKFHG